MKKAALLSFALLSMAAARAYAEIRSVPDDYPTIQQAIQSSNHGDKVIVEPGTYFETINFLGKDIVVTSTDPDDPETVAATIIDANGRGSVVTFQSGETHEAVLTGFTISGGYGTANPAFGPEIMWGAGIYCINASPTIKRNVIANNNCPVGAVEGYGGGIACVVSEAIITNNVIRNNSTFAGAGIMTYPFSDPQGGAGGFGHPTISDNLIYDNSALIGGGVVLLYSGHLINNTIVGNDSSNDPMGQTGFAGSIYVASESMIGQCQIVNNIICNAKSGGGIYMVTPGEDLIAYNDVWNNTSGNYISQDPQTGEQTIDGLADRTGTDGNISEDPLFVDLEANDYHLQLESPCISAGDPDFVAEPDQTDIDGDDRIYGGVVDMGADEYVGYVRPVADAGPDRHVGELQLITLDGSGSFIYDPCGVLMFEWDQLAGPAVELSDPTGMHPAFMPEFEGEYQFELVVIDGTYMSKPDDVLVLVGNQPPIADAGLNRASPAVGPVRLDGTGSYDPDAMDELAYAWTQLEGPQVVLEDADTATPSFDCSEAGVYVFELVVSDGFVDSQPSVVEVTTVSATMSQSGLNAGYDTPNYFYYPDVSGPTVVYSVGSFDNYNWNIKSKNLETGVVDEAFIGGGIDTQPKIDGDIVVWAGGPGYSGFRGPECVGVFAKNLATGAHKTLREYSDTESYSHPVVSANKVVWLEHLNINKYNENDWRNTPYSIRGADITDLNHPLYFTIAEDVGRRDPYPYDAYDEDFDDVIDLSEDRVVWEADGDIYGADISNIDDIKVFTICSDSARQYDPAVSGHTVVWTDERNDDGDIYAADISDTDNIREMTIVRASGTQHQAAIDGCLIVYVDGGTTGGQIGVCCLTRRHGVMDIELSGFFYGLGPVIDGDRIIWQTGTYGQAEGMTLEFAYSPFDGPVENLTTGKHYDYIQHAIVSGQAGDRIVATAGTYYGDIRFKGKNLTVSSTDPNDPAVVAATVINGSSRVVTFSGNEDASCVLSGFTITGGSRGIYCYGPTCPTIANCTITGNTGAGIELYSGGDPTITNSRITANAGAGIEMHPRKSGRFTYYNFPKVTNCVISANGHQGISAGVPTITNCTIVGNLEGGIDNSRATVTNSIICYNGDGADSAQIVNNIGAVTYSNVQGSWPGIGNMDADPCFVSPGYWADANDPNRRAEAETLDIIWVGGDYHLKSEAGSWDPATQSWLASELSSPCIDAGDPDSCIGFEPNPNASVINMGAYGGTAQASKSPSGVNCILPNHPDYDQWVAVGEPVCWCYPRQCHGDADCKSQSTEKFWVSTGDLDILIAAWNKPLAEIEGVRISGLDLVCADFDHKAQGREKHRVSTDDLDILIANWSTADRPDPDCP